VPDVAGPGQLDALANGDTFFHLDAGSAVIDLMRPKPGRIAVGAGTTTGAEAPGGTTAVPDGGAVTTGAGATTTGAGAGVTGSDVAQAASSALLVPSCTRT
jgi:hypothetical protein